MKQKKPWLAEFKNDWQNKKVLIFGLGVLGRGVADAKFFAEIGAQVTVTDLKTPQELKHSLKKLKKFPLNFVFKEHRKEDILESDLILRNAAVPQDSPFLQLARKHSIPVEMDEALFMKYAPVKLIGVTGTRGKSTTTTLIYQILKAAGLSVWLAGNIQGKAALPLLAKVKAKDWVVMELSSWQLQGFDQAKISPYISVFTNIYEDHLNRYSSMKEYIEDKKAIFKYQTKKNFLVLNYDSSRVRGFAKQAKSKVIWFSKKDFPSGWKLKIKGDHNKLNAAAVIKVGEVLGIRKNTVRETITHFRGLAHRLETIETINKVEYINDSTSTTPAAGIAALNSIKKPIVLIAGGNSKNLEMRDFAKSIAQKTRKIIFLEGNETDNLLKLVKKFKAEEKIAGRFRELKKAVLEAKKLVKPGEVVLLSPGCTSFGTFINEFDRGDQFKKLVERYG
jgi:UDP-N-acetylmuramoylalanine--D-glutamate ligase